MKVLLINVNTAGPNEIPINIPLLQAALKSKKHKVEVFDTTYYTYKDFKKDQIKFGFFKSAPLPPVRQPLFKTKKRLFIDLKKTIIRFQPEMIGISTLSTAYKLSCEIATYLKKINNEIPIVFGGIHAIIKGEEIIKNDFADFVCYGEGDQAILDICDYLSKKIKLKDLKNYYYKKNNKIFKAPPASPSNINELPVLDFEGFSEYDMYRPLDGRLYKMLNFNLSRGCVFKCSYCINHFLHKRYNGINQFYRVKNIDKAIENIRYLVNRYNFNCIRFWDEDFTTLSLKYIEKFFELYNEKIKLPFLIYARVETINEKKLKILKKSGCITIAMGIESGNEWLRANILNRKTRNTEIIEKFHLCNKYKIRVSAYNMIGLPFETREMIFDTINLNKLCRPSASSVTFFEPYPDTELYNIAKQFGFLKNDELPEFSYTHPHISSPYITEEELVGLMRTFVFYIKLPKKKYELIKRCEKPSEANDKKLMRILKEIK